MNSSHSATPVVNSDASAFVSVLADAALPFDTVVVVDEVVVVVVVLAALLALIFTVVLPAPPQPNETTAKQNAAAITIKLFKFIPNVLSK
jgi:hypothetical protein